MIKPRETPILDLSNVSGNAFAIMGAACKALKMEGADAEYITQYKDEAMKGNYEHLLQTTMKYCEVE